ncbi:AMIN-like domain-containing (lipo)protein [Actinoplanes subglobosus]|uniref:AMIN-like domain-containing protein n=1 Tax=Actinoplanes subglobosus TaxID=1547892 RepID=A0ABV8J5E1_9ACTN
MFPASRRFPAVLVLLLLTPSAACAEEAAPAPPKAATAPLAPKATTTPVPPAAAATPVPPKPAAVTWGTGPVTVPRSPAVPPVPVVTGIRYAAHPAEGYDRIVFDISGAAPGYAVRYVDEVRADPSDRIVTVPGRAFLLVVLTPAQAHRDDGRVTVSGTRRLDLPMLRAYAVTGDFEGHVSIALGLDDVVGFRVGEASGRIYVDVAA